MQLPSHAVESIDVSRRQLIATTGTVVATGGLLATTGSTPAAGAVSVSTIDIPEATVSGEDTSVTQVDLQVAGDYQYSVAAADTMRLTLAVAPDSGSDFAQIDSSEEPVATTADSGQFSLVGSILEHDALDASDFSADTAETVTTEVPVRVRLVVLHGGETAVESVAEGTAVVTSENTGVEASAAIDASGEVAVEV